MTAWLRAGGASFGHALGHMRRGGGCPPQLRFALALPCCAPPPAHPQRSWTVLGSPAKPCLSSRPPARPPARPAGAPILATGQPLPGYDLFLGQGFFNRYDFDCAGSVSPGQCMVRSAVEDAQARCDADPRCRIMVHLPFGWDYIGEGGAGRGGAALPRATGRGGAAAIKFAGGARPISGFQCGLRAGDALLPALVHSRR